MRVIGVLAAAGLATLAGCASGQQERARLVRAPSACVDQTVLVYFEPRATELTPEGRAVIDAAAAGARACKIASVDVLGLADAAGSPEASLELSRLRARSVSAALAHAGLPEARFELAAAGQAGAITPTGQAAPLRRRVEVTLHVAR